jgi:S1-C subfamily serine protease
MKKKLAFVSSAILVLASISLTYPQSAFASSTKTRAELPQILPVESGAETKDAGTAPEDVLTLTSNIKNSVVGVWCANSPGAQFGSMGTGWSAKFRSPFTKSIEIKSYVITNLHVVDKCLNSEVRLNLSGGEVVLGTVIAWDSVNDLAGIATTTEIPQLGWQGAEPEQGTWTGIIGNPQGLSGTLATGYVLNVVDSHSDRIGFGFPEFPATKGMPSGTTTARTDHGGSGSPVFDREGRIFGIIEGFYPLTGESVFRGTPLLCVKIFACPIDVNAWEGNNVFDDGISPNPLSLRARVQFDAYTTGASKNMLACGFVTSDFTDNYVNQYKVTGIYYKVIDQTANKILLEGIDPLLTNEPIPTTMNTDYLPKYPNMKTTIVKTAKSQTYVARLGTQSAGHQYKCGVAIVANHSIGEITWNWANAEVSGANYEQGLEITCKKGKLTKSVIAKKPVCPKSWVRARTL